MFAIGKFFNRGPIIGFSVWHAAVTMAALMLAVAGGSAVAATDFVCDESLGFGRVAPDGDRCVILDAIIVVVSRDASIDSVATLLENREGWSVREQLNSVKMIIAEHSPDNLTLTQLKQEQAAIANFVGVRYVDIDAVARHTLSPPSPPPTATPLAPIAPRVTETSATSATMSWTVPGNDGPPITSYDLRYRHGSGGNFKDGPQDVSGTSATIKGLSPNADYEVQVRASNAAGDGQWSPLVVVRTAVLKVHGLFRLSLDLDDSDDDQSVTFLSVSPGRVVPIQVFAGDILNTRSMSVRVGYSMTQVVYKAFDVGDALPGPHVLVDQDSTSILVRVNSPGGRATEDSSLVGTLRFLVTDALSETEIRLESADLFRGDPAETMTRSVSVVLQVAAPPSPDFDGSGLVNFADFVLFAGMYGYGKNDAKYDARYDLNVDGGIGFDDFVKFVRSFGTSFNRAPMFAQPTPVTRSVDENTPAGRKVGDPVSAFDADGDPLTYTLWGVDADAFAIDAKTGQIRTKAEYNFEQKRGYAVIVRAADGNGGRVNLVVGIDVVDLDE